MSANKTILHEEHQCQELDGESSIVRLHEHEDVCRLRIVYECGILEGNLIIYVHLISVF